MGVFGGFYNDTMPPEHDQIVNVVLHEIRERLGIGVLRPRHDPIEKKACTRAISRVGQLNNATVGREGVSTGGDWADWRLSLT